VIKAHASLSHGRESQYGSGAPRRPASTRGFILFPRLVNKDADGLSNKPLTAKHSWDDIVRASNGAYVGPASGY
jgi:hypothetical protein